MKLVIRQLRQFVDEKKNDNASYPLNTTNSEVVLSCCKVIQNVIVGGKYEQIVKSLRTDSEFWSLLLDLCECVHFQTYIENRDSGSIMQVERIRNDVNLTHSVGIILSIMAVNLYNTSQLSSVDDSQDKKESIDAFSNAYSNKVYLFIRLLRKSIRYIFSVCNDAQLISDLDVACHEYKQRFNSMFRLADYVIEYRTEGDPVYDIRRMGRWEKSECSHIIVMCEKLNLRLSLSEACVSVLRSIRRMISVFAMSTLEGFPDDTIQDFVDACLTGLRVVSSQSQSRPPMDRYESLRFPQLYILAPVPPVMRQVVAVLHVKTSRILLSTMKCLEKLSIIQEQGTKSIPLSDTQLSQFAEVLDVHLSGRNWEVCKNLLAALLYTFTRVSESNSTLIKRTWLLVSPILFHCAEFGGVSMDCSELAISTLSLFPGTCYSNQNIQFLCKQLSDCLLRFSEKGTHTFTNSLLHLLLNVASTRRGCATLLNNFLIEKLTNATFFHSNEIYECGRRSSWHIIWCLVIQLLIQMYNTSHSLDTNPRHPSNLLSSMSQDILDKICDFCVAHSERILSVLLTTFSPSSHMSLALLTEVDILAKLIFELARSDKLFSNRTLVDACLVCMVQCHSLADRIGFFVKTVQPISDDEIKLYSQGKDGAKEQSVLEAVNREHLSWATRLYLCLFGTMRNLLASIRCMTELPLANTIERHEQSRTVLNEYALRTHVIPFMRTCTDVLLRLSLQHSQSLPIQQDSEGHMIARKVLNKRSAKAIAESVVSALKEALFVIVFHSVLMNMDAKGGSTTSTRTEGGSSSPVRTPLEKELLSMIETLKKDLGHLQQSTLFISDLFKEATELLDATQKSLTLDGTSTSSLR
mmetsp:Transcript_734/g.2441  ORF Transcript_734/g.2441 Transcript_734/m.2441 type:complete len:864 (+) Transcript_734:3-2594(+)